VTQRALHPASPAVANPPISPLEAREHYSKMLNKHELEEIKGFEEIYYVGQLTKKIRPNTSGASNFGFDDSSHHYRCSLGDHIAYRYEIRAILGKGAFGQVLRCYDHKGRRNVALKVIVNTPQMHQQGEIEVAILERIRQAPAFDGSNIVRSLDSFLFRSHPCVTFEVLGQNLFEWIRSFGGRPIEIVRIRAIGKCILTALTFLHANSVVHCDIKPENILFVPGPLADVRVIDFGSSCVVGQQRYEYIQSRFYRAPEVILGIPYGPPMDVWSFGCVLGEMAIGRPLFPGENEEEQMQVLMGALGAPSRDVIGKAARKRTFFAPDGTPIRPQKGKRAARCPSLREMLQNTETTLIDLLERCLTWDPARRISARDALNHQWFRTKESIWGRPRA
jgi:dual specificity tyrosine-phosphorylation-regulated kinase 2/3/4